ncbi:hypothetical protein [Nocardia acidivorans]|uniref:hypothetical protein n=1 Tax=Nocardia acidivorans TaxID=404580 RepID=UPI000A407399|nr:hypothetical protein [Nocardia acidivorans]
MRYGGHPSKEQLQRNFDSMLQRALSGGGLRTETGLDQQTMRALRDLRSAYPNASPELEAAARRAFAGQLDGSNAAARRAEMDRIIAEYE